MPQTRLLTALALAAVLGAPLHAQPDSGAYLAARVAESQNDFRAASGWYGKAILSDSGNARLLEGAILAELGACADRLRLPLLSLSSPHRAAAAAAARSARAFEARCRSQPAA